MNTPLLAVIGGGTMARAILDGAFDAVIVDPARVLLAEPDAEKREYFQSRGVSTVPTAANFAGRLGESTQVLLAVKPQFLADAARDLASQAAGRVVISILAGSTTERLERMLGDDVRIIRTMPNLPARIGRGITAIAPARGVRPGDDAFAKKLFTCVGEVVRIDESLMDAFTAMAGSGPAYVFHLAEAMRDAGVTMGFDQETALQIVRATINGAAALLHGSPDDPSDLRAAVTSRKGTTDAAISAMQADGVKASIERAMLLARDRGEALAKL